MTPLELETAAPEGWFSQYDIAVFVPEIEKLKPRQIYVEVGTYLGRSLWVARKMADPEVVIFGVDLLKDPKVENTYFFQEESAEAAVHFEDGSIDLIFIDANHDYEFVKGDIEAYYPKMASGSVMLFHDCDETSPGVVRAVNEFAEMHGLKIELFKKPGFNTSIARIQL